MTQNGDEDDPVVVGGGAAGGAVTLDRCRRTVAVVDGGQPRMAGLVDDLPHAPRPRERWGRDVLHCPCCHLRARRAGHAVAVR